MRIVTISRQFGSGGRELGKRLSDILECDYYDREIITAIAEKSGFDEGYISEMTQKKLRAAIPLTFGRTMYCEPIVNTNSDKILSAQAEVLREIAEKGKDCVIIGRGADVILEEYYPVKIFVYADMESKMRRCRERAGEDEEMSDKKLIKKIKEIDSARSGYHELLSDTRWGRKESYHLCVNTTGLDIKAMAPVVADYVKSLFT